MNNESKNLVIGQSWEIWDFLLEKTGLDPKGYDQGIIAELCTQLSIPSPCKSIRCEIKKRNVSTEVFIGAFLKALQPYAQMMSDMCAFFYWHGIRKTNHEVKILFDFGQGPEDLGFDLRHFKETLWQYKEVTQSYSVYDWNINMLWNLIDIFSNYRRNVIRDTQANQWLSQYKNSGEFGLPYPVLPTTEIEEIDQWLNRVWNVWTTIVSECQKYGNTRQSLIAHDLRANKDNVSVNDLEENEGSFDSIKHCQELPDFNNWDLKTLLVLDTEGWLEKLLCGIYWFIEQIKSLIREQRRGAAEDTLSNLKLLFRKLPRSEIEKELLEKKLIELLNLPIWRRRHELYQTWILSQIDKVLMRYERTIHQVNGQLILRFSGTHIATIETEGGRLHLWSELRSNFAKPIGKGRKKNIQPDYTLTFEPISEPRQTVIAIECKQYRKANAKNFSEALIDYANGRSNAKVLLVNYGVASQNILANVHNSLRSRTSLIGNLTPSNFKEKIEFFQNVRNALPEPTLKKIASLPASTLHELNRIIFELLRAQHRLLIAEVRHGAFQNAFERLNKRQSDRYRRFREYNSIGPKALLAVLDTLRSRGAFNLTDLESYGIKPAQPTVAGYSRSGQN